MERGKIELTDCQFIKLTSPADVSCATRFGSFGFDLFKNNNII